MKTEQIIKTLQDWKHTWKPTGEVGLTLDAAIERLQTLEKERDEARELAVKLRNYYEGDDNDALPWEEGS